jgi:hypothetical protein
MSSNRQAQVFLVVDHPAILAGELEKSLGLEADEKWNVGESAIVAGKSRLRKFSRWSLNAAVTSPNDVQQAINSLMWRLEPIKERFKQLPSGCRVALSFCVDETDSIFGIGIDARSVAFFGTVNAEIDMSFVVTSSAAENR